MRLDRLFSGLGLCSRKQVLSWLKDGRITSKSGKIVDFNDVDPDDLLLDGLVLDPPPGELLFFFNKPVGVVCSHTGEEGNTVYDFFPARYRLRRPIFTSAGRLDKESSGLLIMTDNGELIHRLTSPNNHLPKKYMVYLDGLLEQGALEKIREGGFILPGESKASKPAGITLLNENERVYEIVLREGKNRQIRKTAEFFGRRVVMLDRVSIGPFVKDTQIGNVCDALKAVREYKCQ